MLTQKNRTYLMYYKSTDSLIDSALHHVNLKDNGSSIIIPHVYGFGKNKSYIYNPKIINRFPIVEANISVALPRDPKKTPCKFIQVHKDKQYNHELVIANMFLLEPPYRNQKRAINYANLIKNLFSINTYITNNTINENKKYEIFTHKISNYIYGINWSTVSVLFEDIIENTNVRVYER